MERSLERDCDLANVIGFVERMRASGAFFSDGSFRVAQDYALEEEQSDLRDAWALREAINAPPRTLAGAQAMVEEMAEQGFITGPDARNLMVTHVDQHRRTITIATRRPPVLRIVADARVREGEAYILPGIRAYDQAVRVTNIGASAPKSRVPEFLRETARLDGRRRR